MVALHYNDRKLFNFETPRGISYSFPLNLGVEIAFSGALELAVFWDCVAAGAHRLVVSVVASAMASYGCCGETNVEERT